MRYLPLTDTDRQAMLATIRAKTIDDLFVDVPEEARLNGPIEGLPMHASEMAVERHFSAMARKNMAAAHHPFFLGAGAYKHHVPASVDHLIQRTLQGVSKPILLPLQVAGDLLVLLHEHPAAPERIDRAPLRRRHQPCPGPLGNPFLGPDFEGRHERILRQLFGDADVAGDASDGGDEACGLGLPHGLDRPVNLAHPSELTGSVARALPPPSGRPPESQISRESLPGSSSPPRGF